MIFSDRLYKMEIMQSVPIKDPQMLRVFLDRHSNSYSEEMMQKLACRAINLHQFDSLRLLIPYCGVDSNNTMLKAAILANVSLDLIQQLIAVSRPKNNQSEVLLMALRFDRKDILPALIAVSNPRVSNNEALVQALLNNNQYQIDLLYPHCDGPKTLRRLAREHPKACAMEAFKQRVQDDAFCQTLTEHTKEFGVKSQQRKM